MTQGSDCVFPPTLIEEMPELEAYQIVADTQTPEAIRSVEKQRFKIARKLFERDWDLFFLLFSGSDHISHEMYAEMQEEGGASQGAEVFQDLDRYLGWFMEHLPPDTDLLVMSDHGFQVFPTIFYINSWLAQEGYLTLRGNVRPEGEDFLSKMQDEPEREDRGIDLSQLSRPFFEHPRLYRLGKRVYRSLRSLLPFDIHLQSRGVDLSQSVAYAATNECKGVYVNDEGRFEDGVVDEEKLHALREEIIVKLKSLIDPFNGQPVFNKVWRKEELYHGAYLRYAPDIILEPNVFVSFLLRSVEPFEETAVNYHSRDGIFLAWGPDINRGAVVNDAEIVDLTPTILHLMDLPVPEDVDGNVLREIFRPGSDPHERLLRFRQGTGVKTVTSGQQLDEDERAVRDRLRALGYWA
jgi:predicted AlkP superfamily phosphohydrolase/phosphomutase